MTQPADPDEPEFPVASPEGKRKSPGTVCYDLISPDQKVKKVGHLFDASDSESVDNDDDTDSGDAVVEDEDEKALPRGVTASESNSDTEMEHDEAGDCHSPRGSKVQKTNARDADVSAGKENTGDNGVVQENNNDTDDVLKVRKESVDANAKSRETKETELLVYPLEMPEELGLPCRDTGTGSIALFDTSGVDDKENGKEH